MMKATSHQGPTLERRQPTNRAEPRLALRRLRVALHALIAYPGGQHTPSPAHPWHDLTRDTPRATHPCEKERAMIAAAIRQGCTTPDQVLTYFLVRIADAMAEFSTPIRVSDVCYVRLMAEQAEALEAQALARAHGTEEARAIAARETEDVIGIAQLYVAQSRHQLPHGAPR